MNTCSLALVALVAFIPVDRSLAEINNHCTSNGHTNGCSIPNGWPYFYKNVFKPGCDKHDICYACGNLFGIRRSTCDTRFWHDLQDICRNDPTVNYDLWCQVISTDYYLAVSLAGSSHYEEPSSSWCCENWVSYCLEEERPPACAFWNDPWWNYAK